MFGFLSAGRYQPNVVTMSLVVDLKILRCFAKYEDMNIVSEYEVRVVPESPPTLLDGLSVFVPCIDAV